jgi:hypothetical protein
MKPKPQTIENWNRAAKICIEKGWAYTEKFSYIFLSPSKTLHDLSAADLNQLDRIEKEGLFLV